MEGRTYKKMSVSCPVEGKDGKTYWKSMGIGFVNRDNSINIILDSYPVNGKLHVSEWKEFKDPARAQQRELPAFSDAPAFMPPPSNDLPF